QPPPSDINAARSALGRGCLPSLLMAGQLVRELGPRCHAELSEYLAQVVVDASGTEEQLLGDLYVGRTASGHFRDAGFLGGEMEVSARRPRPGSFAGSAQLTARFLSESGGAHRLKHVLGDAKLAARVAASFLAPQPL